MTREEELKQIMDDAEKETIDLPGDDWRPACIKNIYASHGRPVFVTMDNMDALAIMTTDYPAAGLNGGENYYLFLELLRDRRTDNTLILCNDHTGAIPDLADGLREINVPFVVMDIDDNPNDFLDKDPAAFRAAIAEAERKALKPDSIKDYITYDMPADIETLRRDAGRKTGFSNLDDAAGSLSAGLYIGGGVSAVGKTTFYLQLGNQLAANGQHVLFFSLEQSRLEMVAKSIASRTAQNGQGVEAAQIRQGAKGENIERAFREYSEIVGDRLSVIEGNFDCNVSYISTYTKNYILRNNARPVVIIDYLQILGAALDPDTHRKPTDPRQIVDANVTALKRLSRALSIPVLVVSSMNRANYLTPIDFESFKESGAIEYTADVIWGVQLAAIHEALFESDPKKDVTKKRERINAAKNSNPREIELVCLKNRYGRNYSCTFKYFPQYDYFVPDDGFRETDGDPFGGLPLN